MKAIATTISRRFYLAALGLALTAGAVGCKDFLEVAPQGQLTEDQIRTDPAAAQKLVDGVYNTMYLGGFGPDIHGLQFVILTDIASDDSDKGSTPQDYSAAAEVDNLTLNATNGVVNNAWKGYFQGINRANQALDKIPLSPAPETTRNRLIGEVRFLRGYFYFNMVRLFGGVPKLDRVPAASELNNPELQKRATAQEIYQLIIDDLQFAANNLPLKGATETGRATKAAAQAMLAKVYLYQKNYQQAYALTNEIITGKSGAYGLYPNYEGIWREVGANSQESIFEVQTGINSACNNSAVELYTVSQGPRSGGRGGWADLGFGFNTPTQQLADAYEPGDKRRAGSIIFITTARTGTVLWDGFRIPSKDSVENFRYSYKAYHSRTQEKNCGNNDFLPKNIRVMRYAEVLLINAEAAFQTGNTAVALTNLNLVRSRAGLPARTTVTLANIWQERRVELALEHDRFFDLVRQESVQPGRIVPIFAAQGKTFTKGKNELFPIPQEQIDLSGGQLTQNPGY
ncbi:RagB/SusD family nutrient uptake outer membrane protein [Hymenobacter taeanensis]|uniref:RagB/SusD family nutrient uptake outer membrane protein n=1 Tax=Hymenobacter taeanensis TaxID=2735321 RepID=A0A6M6BM34_9BACT|nr:MULTISPECIES: RagB/SusD family nutrient uptake outer membrane protein [Hymenobacter]QJX48888.1 RagB/SusD family nutrient uptake outer membrane protein [Hymenobacter taeanensis]UOQ81599.1 RagB/SusD family nutrient uptake outer membrane protein [Hymenobacter sp. 5414T-23]